MYEPGSDHHRDCETDGVIRRICGVGTLLFGIAVAIGVLASLVGMLASDDTPALVNAVVPVIEESITLGLPEGHFTLPRQAFVPLGYLLLCFVNAIAAGIAGVLINGGTSLLQSDVAKLLRRVTEQQEWTKERKAETNP